jgi:uncharacterized protein YfiM (DUF2279 family)
VAAALTAAPLASAGEKPKDSWLAFDKLQHFVFSSHISLFTYKAARDSFHHTPAVSRAEAITLTFSFSLGKEFLDLKRSAGRFSYKDLVIDFLGIGAGLALGHNLK